MGYVDCNWGSVTCWLFTGVLGIKVKIMLPWDPTGKTGPKKPLPDNVAIANPKEEVLPQGPGSEHKGQSKLDASY